MKKMAIVIGLGLGLTLWAQGGNEDQSSVMVESFDIRGSLPDWQDRYTEDQVERAVFAGGCFWGVEAVFEQLQGVLEVKSGYSGGNAETAFYKVVGSGQTGHAEAVEIVFDPKQIDYNTLLEVFFTVAHDPTQLNYQGPDIGSEYRSAIFYMGSSQRNEAKSMIDALNAKKAYPKSIVTELVPLEAFYPAEDYHQDFLRLNPNHGYIVYWDIPKIEHLWQEYPELIYK